MQCNLAKLLWKLLPKLYCSEILYFSAAVIMGTLKLHFENGIDSKSLSDAKVHKTQHNI